MRSVTAELCGMACELLVLAWLLNDLRWQRNGTGESNAQGSCSHASSSTSVP
jgi:hypothetical protein